MPKIRIPLSVVRSVPKHYTWFMVEGTPPIQARLANSSTRLEGGAVVKGLKFTQTGNYTILAKNDAGNSSKTVDVIVMGRVLSQVNMLICRTIFQHHPVIPVLFLLIFSVFPDRTNQLCCFWTERTDGVFFQSREDVFNIVVYNVI